MLTPRSPILLAKKRRRRKAKKTELVTAGASAAPTETETSSCLALKRGRSIEEPHPDAKKPHAAQASQPNHTIPFPSVISQL